MTAVAEVLGRQCDGCRRPITQRDFDNLDFCEPHDLACEGPGSGCACLFVVHGDCCWTCSPDGRLRELVRRLVAQIGDPAVEITGVYTDLLIAAREVVEPRTDIHLGAA